MHKTLSRLIWIYICAFMVILLAGFSCPAMGGNIMEYEFIGFSNGGSYLAFEQFGVHAGSGFSHSSIFIVDVEKNGWLCNPISFTSESETYDLHRARRKTRRMAAALLKKYGIKQGHTGNHVVSHLPNDLTAFEGPVRFSTDTVLWTLPKAEYELVLKQKLSPNPYNPLEMHDGDFKGNYCFRFQDPTGTMILDLTLSNLKERKRKILQSDKIHPKSRNCAFSYHIQDVFVLSNSIAVFVVYYGPSIEGPDRSYMVVTGKL